MTFLTTKKYIPIEEQGDGSLTADDKVLFTESVSGQDPTLDNHLTTKTYVDTQTAAASAGVGALLGIGEWKYDIGLTPPPNDKMFSFDTVAPSAATKFYLDYTNENGDDLSSIVAAIAGNGNVALYFQNRRDADDAFFIRANGFTDQTTYGEFDIADAIFFDPPISTGQRYACIIGEYGSGGATLTTEYTTSEGESSTTSATYQQKLRLTTTSLVSGTYMIQYSWEMDGDNNHGFTRAQLNDATDLSEDRYDSSLIDYIMISGFAIESLSGVNTIDIDFRANSGGDTMLIRRARIALWRIS